MSPYQALANEIVRMAAEDYQRALRYLIRRPHGRIAGDMAHTVEECERFFQSQWFEVLTDLDGPALMKRLRRDAIGRETIS